MADPPSIWEQMAYTLERMTLPRMACKWFDCIRRAECHDCLRCGAHCRCDQDE